MLKNLYKIFTGKRIELAIKEDEENSLVDIVHRVLSGREEEEQKEKKGGMIIFRLDDVGFGWGPKVTVALADNSRGKAS